MECVRPVYTKHSALGTTRQDTRVSFRIYQAINTMVPNLCKCVQQVRGLWKIYPVTSEARSRLLASGIMFKGKKIKLHDEDPFETDKIPSEKIIIRDLPIDVRDDDIISFLQEHCNKLTLRSPMIADKIRDNNNRMSDCLNGNRHIYVQSGFSTVLPEVAIIDEHRCRIYHESQALHCKRCQKDGHRVADFHACPAYIPEDERIQIFWQGWDPLSNFYACNVNIYEHVFTSSEHAYQYRKMIHIGNQKLADAVLQAKSPRDAKNIAHKVPADQLKDWDSIKCNVMREVLCAKMKSCKKYLNALFDSGSNCLIEGTMDMFWGCGQNAHIAATTDPYYLLGKNWLGTIHMDLRQYVLRNEFPPDGPAIQISNHTSRRCSETDDNTSLPDGTPRGTTTSVTPGDGVSATTSDTTTSVTSGDVISTISNSTITSAAGVSANPGGTTTSGDEVNANPGGTTTSVISGDGISAISSGTTTSVTSGDGISTTTSGTTTSLTPSDGISATTSGSATSGDGSSAISNCAITSVTSGDGVSPNPGGTPTSVISGDGVKPSPSGTSTSVISVDGVSVTPSGTTTSITPGDGVSATSSGTTTCITSGDAISDTQLSTPTDTDATSKSEPVLTDASEHEASIQSQDHEKEVCEDYTVSNITRIMRPLDQSSDTVSIAEEIQAAEIQKRRIVKHTKVKINPPLTPVQKGPLDNFISRVKRKLTPEKELDSSVNNQKQVCSETSKI